MAGGRGKPAAAGHRRFRRRRTRTGGPCAHWRTPGPRRPARPARPAYPAPSNRPRA